MSNRSNARAIKIPSGWIAEYRPAWRAEYIPIIDRDENGRRLGMSLFATEAEAECAAWRALRDVEEPVMTSSGAMPGRARQAAEAIFRKVEA